MEEEIVKSILLRPGVPDNKGLIKDMVCDCIAEIRDAINYSEKEEFPKSLYGIVKELVLEKINRDGTQGIQSESYSSGGSTTFLDDIPKNVKRQIYRKRKFRKG